MKIDVLGEIKMIITHGITPPKDLLISTTLDLSTGESVEFDFSAEGSAALAAARQKIYRYTKAAGLRVDTISRDNRLIVTMVGTR
ncbi:MAG: hypothetical protein IPG31_00065 [Nitrosomonas sp.]|nr:hypothetical protein [Nitrosomonas sp.]